MYFTQYPLDNLYLMSVFFFILLYYSYNFYHSLFYRNLISPVSCDLYTYIHNMYCMFILQRRNHEKKLLVITFSLNRVSICALYQIIAIIKLNQTLFHLALYVYVKPIELIYFPFILDNHITVIHLCYRVYVTERKLYKKIHVTIIITDVLYIKFEFFSFNYITAYLYELKTNL